MIMPDVSLLVAHSIDTHAYNRKAVDWFEANPTIATCAITELGLLRVLIQLGIPVRVAESKLQTIISDYRGAFLDCDLSAAAVIGKVRGHKQTTDQYLVHLCAKHSMRLATLDRGIREAVFVG